MASFTPGPWCVDRTLGVSVAHAHGAKEVICDVNTIEQSADACGCGGDPAANARLIAKAPQMLALLRDCESVLRGETPMYVGNGPHTQSLQEKLAELIAEVEGEQ